MADEVDELVGSKGQDNRDRRAVRHGNGRGKVTLGGWRVAIERGECAPPTAAPWSVAAPKSG
jgi:hypothetical protein